jgi:hypothetical protein
VLNLAHQSNLIITLVVGHLPLPLCWAPSPSSLNSQVASCLCPFPHFSLPTLISFLLRRITSLLHSLHWECQQLCSPFPAPNLSLPRIRSKDPIGANCYLIPASSSASPDCASNLFQAGSVTTWLRCGSLPLILSQNPSLPLENSNALSPSNYSASSPNHSLSHCPPPWIILDHGIPTTKNEDRY